MLQLFQFLPIQFTQHSHNFHKKEFLLSLALSLSNVLPWSVFFFSFFLYSVNNQNLLPLLLMIKTKQKPYISLYPWNNNNLPTSTFY